MEMEQIDWQNSCPNQEENIFLKLKNVVTVIGLCLYCKGIIKENNFLTCINCDQHVHFDCTNLSGAPEVVEYLFGKYLCTECSIDNEEKYFNTKLNDVQIHQLETNGFEIVDITSQMLEQQSTFDENLRKHSQQSAVNKEEAEPDRTTTSIPTKRVVCKGFTKKPKRELPWLKDEGLQIDENSTNFETEMSQAKENELMSQLEKIINLEHAANIDIPMDVRLFYRNMRAKRLRTNLHYNNIKMKQTANILDRFFQVTVSRERFLHDSFNNPLTAISQHDLFTSPYTSRILHSFIFRSKKLFPPWLQILCEIKCHKNNNLIPDISTIDFCYLRPDHVAGVNSLLQRLFWPGIDVSECLSYPDFTVVALYKKLIIGCAFLVPDTQYNEAYISFMAVLPGWNRVGIASFMLYHLIQTCMGKDVTLHVSASNPAICLYQKFGFKIEKVVLDFYEKYFPPHTKHSLHAFFLRLKR